MMRVPSPRPLRDAQQRGRGAQSAAAASEPQHSHREA